MMDPRGTSAFAHVNSGSFRRSNCRDPTTCLRAVVVPEERDSMTGTGSGLTINSSRSVSTIHGRSLIYPDTNVHARRPLRLMRRLHWIFSRMSLRSGKPREAYQAWLGVARSQPEVGILSLGPTLAAFPDRVI